jgi:hypothetical protein
VGFDIGSVALSLGGVRRLSQVGSWQIEKHARSLGLDPSERIARAQELVGLVPAAFTAEFDQLGGLGTEMKSRTLPRLTKHCASIGAMLSARPSPGSSVSGPPRGQTSAASNAGSFRPRTHGESDIDLG